MKLREIIANHPDEVARLEEEKRLATQKESQRLQKEWEEEKLRMQPELQRTIEEFHDNNRYIQEIADLAISYVNPVLSDLHRRLQKQFPITEVNLANLQYKPSQREPPQLGHGLYETKYYIEPPAVYREEIKFGVFWGNISYEKYSKFLQGTYERQDMARFSGYILLYENDPDLFGKFNIHNSNPLPLQSWQNNPTLIRNIIELAYQNPLITKFNRPYEEPPSPSPSW